VVANVVRELSANRQHWVQRRSRVLHDQGKLLTSTPGEFLIRAGNQITTLEICASSNRRSWREQTKKPHHRHCLATSALARNSSDLTCFHIQVYVVNDSDNPARRREAHPK
jgi:hypothetical protein